MDVQTVEDVGTLAPTSYFNPTPVVQANGIVAVQNLDFTVKQCVVFGDSVESAIRNVNRLIIGAGVSAESLNPTLQALERHAEAQLANVHSLRETIQKLRTVSLNEVFSNQTFSGDRLYQTQASGANDEVAEKEAAYWRSIRDSLQSWFAVTVEELGAALGLSYATVANLGKRKPQGKTVGAILRLHSAARSYIDEQGDALGREWLASIGRQILLDRGSAQLQRTLEDILFGGTKVDRQRVRLDAEESEIEWTTRASSLHGEAF